MPNPIDPKVRRIVDVLRADASAPLSEVGITALDAFLEHVAVLEYRDALLLERILSSNTSWGTFTLSPAGRWAHHAYPHGLLEHSADVATRALRMASELPAERHIDVSRLILGALLHDVGKIFDYVLPTRGDERPAARAPSPLGNHITSGVVFVALIMEAAKSELASAGARQIDLDHLMHVIVSHHGRRVWGSPVPPRTREARLIHRADRESALLASGPRDALRWWGETALRRARARLTPTGHRATPLPSVRDLDGKD